MKQGLQLRFSQNLTLTPQLQLSIRLLQLSSQELNQELESILQANPLLEHDVKEDNDSSSDSFDSADMTSASTDPHEFQREEAESETDYFTSDQTVYTNNRWVENNPGSDEEQDYNNQEAATETLREHLLGQLQLLPLSERDQALAVLLIDAINDDGYLEQSLDELAELIEPAAEVDPLELQTVLKHVQNFDPAGVGARDLAECLSLQLRHCAVDDADLLALTRTLAEQHLQLLAARDYSKLCKLLHCDETTLRQAQQIITQLNPRPGSSYSSVDADHYIQPDIIVKKVKGIWVARLNDEIIPKLRINQIYANILKRSRDSSNQYLLSQMQEAKWMIKNIQQRFSTILRVSQAIVDRQRNFFEHGEIAMRPLVLREIADELDLHESTISRVTTRKYMLTPRGVYELKYFFGSHVATETGDTYSATAIRALIKQIIAEEDPRKPLSDSQITNILSSQGIVVARRTIAKYRDSLQLPAASQRKSL